MWDCGCLLTELDKSLNLSKNETNSRRLFTSDRYSYRMIYITFNCISLVYQNLKHLPGMSSTMPNPSIQVRQNEVLSGWQVAQGETQLKGTLDAA